MATRTRISASNAADLKETVRPASERVAEFVQTYRNVPESNIRAFATFLDRVSKIRLFNSTGDSRPGWKVFSSESLDVAWKKANDTALSDNVDVNGHRAHADAINYITGMLRKSDRSASVSALSEMVWYKVWATARPVIAEIAPKASHDITKHLAWHATMKSQQILLQDISLQSDEKHVRHIEENFRVWEMGCGLVYNMNGVLYVFSNGKKSDDYLLRD